MKILILLIFLNFFLSVSPCAMAAESAADKETVKTESPAKEEAAKEDKKEEAKETPGEYTCPFYKVNLPPDWKAIRSPEEKQGIINAIFAKNTASPVITMIVGPRQGAEPEMIAGMFAEQFKAGKDPVQKNDQFFFSFPQTPPDSQTPITAHACLGIDGDYFMLTIYTGNQKEAQNFIKNDVSSEKYPGLLPKY